MGVKGLLRSSKSARYYRNLLPHTRQSGFITHLDLHALGLDDVDLVLVAAPNLIVDHSHAADGVMRPTEVH